MNYASAKDTKLRFGQKRLAANVYLRPVGDDFAVRYYDTDVVTICKDGSAILKHGGFITKSTAALIREFSPVEVDVDWKPSHPDHFVLVYVGQVYVWPRNLYRLRLLASGTVQKWEGEKWVRVKPDTE